MNHVPSPNVSHSKIFTHLCIVAAVLICSARPALAQDSAGFLIGFRDAVLKTSVNHGGNEFRDALEKVIPSSRRREISTKTTGRLRRNITNSIARGKQASLGLIGATVVHTNRKANNSRIQEAVRLGLVRYVTPNIRISIAAVPNDPDFGKLWGMNNTQGGFLSTANVDINAPEAWDISKGNDSTIVAVLDTGIDPTHPDLAANIWVNSGEIPGNGIDDDGNGYIDDYNGCNFITYDVASGGRCGAKVYNNHNHGTHLAGTIGARGDNKIGVSGVAPNVKMISLAFLDDSGSGLLSDMIEAIDYAIKIKQRAAKGQKGGANIRVINGSFGHNEGFEQPEYDAFKALEEAGILFVAAAGNGGQDGFGDNNDTTPTYPSSYELDSLISVASISKSGALSIFSNYGAESVDIAAPGSGIISTVFNGGYESQSGTSMAAPHVTGAAALLLSYQPKLTPWVAKQLLLASVKDSSTVPALSSLNGKLSSPGMLDIAAALKVADTDLSAPRILKDPKSQSVAKGGSVVLAVQAFSTSSVTYQWYKNGSAIAGAKKASLTLKAIQESDAGSYHCVASSGSQSAQSKPAQITIADKVSADINGDGKINFSDMLALFTDMGKKGAGLRSDLNGDLTVDLNDLQTLLQALKV